MAHLLRKRQDVDRLLEVAGEAGIAEPGSVIVERQGAQRHDRNRSRPEPARECPGRLGAVHVGQPEIHQYDVRQMLVCERDPVAGSRGLQRPEAGGEQHVARELQVLSVVVHDQDEWAGGIPGRGRTPLHVPIRLVLADDHYLVREGVRRLLETEPDLEVAAVCSDLDSLLAAVDAERPDVVVTDIRMPPGNDDEGIQAAARLRETNPEVGVVVLSQYASRPTRSRSSRAAARAAPIS